MKKVLLIEDDEEVQKIYKEALEGAGFATLPAFNSDGALPLARDQKPDLIILDIMLPGKMNGFDILEDLKKNDQTKQIPVIVLTNLESEKKVALEIGAADYFIKANTSIDEMIQRIKTLLG